MLEKVDSDDLSVHVVWTPVLGPDKRSSVDRAHKIFSDDERVVQYWDGDQSLGQTYGELLELPNGRSLAWDIYFVYEPGVQWGEKPPLPDYWMHQLGRDERSLNADTLRESIVAMLATGGDS